MEETGAVSCEETAPVSSMETASNGGILAHSAAQGHERFGGAAEDAMEAVVGVAHLFDDALADGVSEEERDGVLCGEEGLEVCARDLEEEGAFEGCGGAGVGPGLEQAGQREERAGLAELLFFGLIRSGDADTFDPAGEEDERAVSGFGDAPEDLAEVEDARGAAVDEATDGRRAPAREEGVRRQPVDDFLPLHDA